MNQKFQLNSKYVLLLVMLYVAASVAADTVAYNFSSFFGFLESGATIIFPITYILGDIISEVYGWNTAMKVVWLGLLSEALFAGLILFDLSLKPFHSSGVDISHFHAVLDNMWLFVAGGIISNAIAGLLNVYFISKWKVWTKGKVFWVRSILSTCISEFILIVVTILIAFLPFYGAVFTAKVFVDAYILEIIYAFIFVIPAQLIVSFLKKSEKIDNYDYDISYNPFKFSEKTV
tara:strand:+ start:1726 stop:2424 length:699 start_codon:yes stop_codon:yes gene_type:complete